MAISTSTMLPDLQKLVVRLLADLKERALENTEVDAKLRGVFSLHQKQNRTSQAYEMWRADELEQVAVAWVLGCVFIRFLEDNDLLGKTYLAGEASRQEDADTYHSAYFRTNPIHSDRDFFYHVFGEMKKIPALKDLFSENRTPLWLVGPSADGAAALRQFWMEKDPNTGKLKRSFVSQDWDTRFLGDLYQDLSSHVREKYALLQTPDFVESFILDYTLEPAVKDFGLETVRMIDPTCGSGHFLLGAFHRLLEKWLKREPGQNITQLVTRALAAIHGTDINPYAVAIARFRLILAALRACEIYQLKNAPYFELNLAAGDSLMFGNRRTFDGRTFGPEFALFDDSTVLQNLFVAEDRREAHAILSKEFHAVVGNPPYITAKDSALRTEYRNRYATCHGKYSLGVPFTERFVELALKSLAQKPAGYVGMITTNSFMKREFGKKLIEDFVSKIDLSHVIDTSDAYIPGHGTPTVILFAQNRPPVSQELKAALGIRGEPSTPADPSKGLVWSSITQNIQRDDFENEFISVKKVQRGTFSKHPWSIGGGGAAELKELLEEGCAERLSDHCDSIGVTSFTLEDDFYLWDEESLQRRGIPNVQCRSMVLGEEIRDWTIESQNMALFPYNAAFSVLSELPIEILKVFWPYRTSLSNCKMFGGKTKVEDGLRWWEYGRLNTPKLKIPLSITFAFVASHNHFVLDRGGKVFNRSAPVIKLPPTASEDDHLALIGLLNSSTACFWMKQVFYPKSSASTDVSSEKGKPESNRYEFASTGLESFPVPYRDISEAQRLIDLSRKAVALSESMRDLLPEKILFDAASNTYESLHEALENGRCGYEHLKRKLIFLQEEMDWEVYRLFKLTNVVQQSIVSDDNFPEIDSNERPFLLKESHREFTDNFSHIYHARQNEIKANSLIKQIETVVYKRPWWGRQGVYGQSAGNYTDWIKAALEAKILEILESEQFWIRKEIRSIFSIAEQLSADSHFLVLAQLLLNRIDFNSLELVNSLVCKEHVPYVPALRLKDPGFEKHRIWKRIWELQRREDLGAKELSIPVPPKYMPADFRSSDFWRMRGKLDVPKERFVSFPGSERAGDSSLPIAWAGWNHLELATAIAAYYTKLKEEESDAKAKLVPLLVVIHELVPWLLQWHNEFNDEYQQRMGDFYNEFVLSESAELGLTKADLENWKPAQTKTARKRAKKTGGDA